MAVICSAGRPFKKFLASCKPFNFLMALLSLMWSFGLLVKRVWNSWNAAIWSGVGSVVLLNSWAEIVK